MANPVHSPDVADAKLAEAWKQMEKDRLAREAAEYGNYGDEYSSRQNYNDRTAKQKAVEQHYEWRANETYRNVTDALKTFEAGMFYTDEDFPTFDKTIGLPPLYTSQDVYDFSFNVEDQMISSFPILTIQPMNYTMVSPNQKLENAEMKKINKIFKFAVLADNTISYNHANTYSPAAITQDLQNLMTFSTAGEVRQLLNVGGGVFGGSEHTRKIMNAVPALLSQAIESINAGFAANPGVVPNSMIGLGTDVLRNMLMGARTDFPNIWQGSQTGMTWSFTVELRTYASDVTSQMYKEDILLPMEVLLSLSLPKGGNIMSYIEPPYITANIPNILDVKMGAISNLNWNIPLSEINMRGVPRHIQVQFTITDLYNVMVQSKNAEKDNPDFPNRYRFLKTLESKPSKKAGNEDLWKHEFFRNAPTKSEQQTESKLPVNEKTRQSVAGSVTNTSDVDYADSAFGDTFAKNYKWQYPTVSYNNITSTLDWSLPNLLDSSGTPGVSCFKIPNIKNISGIDVNKLLAGGNIPIDLINKNVSLSMNSIINPFGDSLTNMGGIINGKIFNNLQNILNPLNMQTLSNGLFSQTPTNLFSELSNVSAFLIQDIIQSLDGSSLDIKSPLDLLKEAIINISSQLISILNGETINYDYLLRNVVTTISKNNTKLDNELRLSQTLQQILQRSSEMITDNVLNNVNTRTDIINLVNEGKTKLGSTELLPKEVSNSFSNISEIMGGTVIMSSLEGIMQSTNRTNNGKSSLIVRNKS